MLNFELRRDADALFKDVDRWNRLAGGNPFLETHWLATWWANLADQNEPAIVLASDANGELVGALPLYRRGGGRTLGVMSDGSACGDFLAPLCIDDDAVKIAKGMGEFLAKSASDPVNGWDLLDFDGGVEGDPLFAAMVEGLRTAGCSTHVSSRLHCWRRPKELLWEDHLRSHGKSQRRRMRQLLGKIDSETIKRRTVENDAEFEVLVNDVIDLHQKRWIANAEPGSFADPNLRQFAIEMMLAFYRQGRAMVNAIEFRGRTVAGELVIIGENRIAYSYSSGYDIDHADLEPGRMVSVNLMHRMYDADSNFSAVEFMRGDEAYKNRFATERRRLYHLRAFAPELPAQIRSAAYRTNFQFKQWFRRATGRDLVAVANL